MLTTKVNLNSKLLFVSEVVTYFGFVGFLAPKNVDLGVEFKALSYLEAEIWTNMHFPAAILKIQDGRHVDTCANGNIGFLIAYAILF